MNNILTKPGMFDKALHQFLDTGAINNSDFHLQNLDFVYRAPSEFAMPDHSNVVKPTRTHPSTYTINNPITVHSSHDQKVSGHSDTSVTSSGSHSKSTTGTSTTTTTVEVDPLSAEIQLFLERTKGRNVDYDAIEADEELIRAIYAQAERTNGEVADYYDDLNEADAEDGNRLVLMLI